MDGIGLITVVLTILSSNVHAAENVNDNSPTLVYSSAATADGKENVFIVEQPKDAPNPLGNPLPDTPSPQVVQPALATPHSVSISQKQSTDTQNYNVPTNLPAEDKALGQKFQNTIMEADGMVYDVQAYPTQDLKLMSNPSNPQTIYSPNVND